MCQPASPTLNYFSQELYPDIALCPGRPHPFQGILLHPGSTTQRGAAKQGAGSAPEEADRATPAVPRQPLKLVLRRRRLATSADFSKSAAQARNGNQHCLRE